MPQNVHKSSIAYDDVVRPHLALPTYPTWAIIIVLIIVFFILKFFIYLKDGNRHGK